MKISTKKISAFALSTMLFMSCSNDDDDTSINPIDPVVPGLVVPDTYSFSRDGQNTVRIPGQIERIRMGEEIIDAFLDFDALDGNTSLLNDMFTNTNNSFTEAGLNASSRQIRNTVASSEDLFEGDSAPLGASGSVILRTQFDTYIDGQINDVRLNRNRVAAAGVSGQIADGTSIRYIDGRGVEFNQIFTKGLIGGLMVDQIVNNYISASLLDEGTNREDNDNEVPRNDSGTDTQMEHRWDEAYGYIYGNSQNVANPNPTIGEDDRYLNRYVGLVDNDPDFNGIAERIFNAFITGRAAISQGFYDIRDEQTEILREEIARVLGVRAVFYLQSGRRELEAGNTGGAFHDISEGLGFIVSLQFARIPGSPDNAPVTYFTRDEVQALIDRLLSADITNSNGLWDVTSEILNAVSADIAAEFDFTVEEAGDNQN